MPGNGSAAALGLLGALLVVLTPTAGAEELRVLSYNTHGLPDWVARDEPAQRFPRIGELANDYSLVFLQEDFEHHAVLRTTTLHETVLRGNESQHWLCFWCSGAGLTLLASPPVSLAAIWNVPYRDCSGWLFGGSDCMASKGFQLARISLPNRAELYVANTHLDAGAGRGDRAAREQQLELLRTTLEDHVGDAALLVGGDFNLDASDPTDTAMLGGFRESLGLVDSGARAGPDSDWQVLDYVLFRSGAGALLEVKAAGEDPAFSAEGKPLSDHPAIFARFHVRPTRAARRRSQRVVEIPPSTGITAPVTYAPARDAR